MGGLWTHRGELDRHERRPANDAHAGEMIFELSSRSAVTSRSRRRILYLARPVTH